MAIKIIITSDHDGKELPDHREGDTTHIQLGEMVWSAYLSEKQVQALEDHIRNFLPELDPADPEPAPRTKSASVSATPAEKEAQRTAIREWVEASTIGALQGVVIGDRGRIPQHVLDAYYKAHPKQPKLFGSAT